MIRTSTPSGIQAVGEVPFGTHFCQFYRTRQDLIETLVPYFMEGLRSNELCLWVTSSQLPVAEALDLMHEAMPDFSRYLESGQIAVYDFQDWYLKNGGTPDQALAAWVEHERRAIEDGFEGLRLTGDTACRNHQFALTRNRGGWELIESSSLKIAKEELARLNEELEIPGIVPDDRSAEDLKDIGFASGRKILVADDNPDSAESLGMLLEIAGHEICLAYDGQEALDQADRFGPEIILLDIGLPRMDGYEVAERLRRSHHRDVLLVAVTGYGTDADRKRSREAGFDHHLVKPVDPAALRDLIANAPALPARTAM